MDSKKNFNGDVNSKPVTSSVNSDVKKSPDRDSATHKAGDAIEHAGDAIAKKGAQKVGKAVHDLGDKIEHMNDK